MVGKTDLPAALRGAFPDEMKMLLAHNPVIVRQAARYAVDLVLSGHTHGGQVRIPRYGALVTNSDLPRSQASGLSLWKHAMRAAYLNVSAGLGTSIYAPVRFACKPEAVLLTLTGDDIRYS